MSPDTQPRVIQEDFSYGINTDAAPHRIDPRGLADLQNGLYEEDGSVFGRGGAQALSDAAASGLTWGFDGHFDVGRRTITADDSAFYTLASDETLLSLGSDGLELPPVGSVLFEGILFIGGGYMYAGSRKTATYSTGTVAVTNGSTTVTGTGFSANVDAGMLFQAQASSERLYVVASVDSDTQLTLRDAYEGTTGASVAYTLKSIYKIEAADPYVISDGYAVCANRLLTWAGNTLTFSEIQRPHDQTIDIDSEQIPNTHDLPEGARITGVGVIGLTTLIFSLAGIWALEGLAFDIVDAQGNTNHRMQILSRELIAYGQVATWKQALIVPCLSGIFLMDGVSAPQRMSHPIEELWRDYIDSGYRPGQPAVDRDHYILPVIDESPVVQDVLIARLDRTIEVSGDRAHPWARALDADAECSAFAVRYAEDPAEPILLGFNTPLKKVLDCSHFFEPRGLNKLGAHGSAPVFEMTTRDYATGNGTENAVRSVRLRRQLVDAAADDPVIDILYATGTVDPTLPWWGNPDGEWGTGFAPDGDEPWGASANANFHSACVAGEDPDGTTPKRCSINTTTRFIRYRLRCDEPRASLRIRSLESFIRPSEAVRR